MPKTKLGTARGVERPQDATGSDNNDQPAGRYHNYGGVNGDYLRSFVERIERLEEEKAALAADVREVKAEAKSAGFDVKTINRILKERKMDDADRQEQEALLDTYRHALGMLTDTPLGLAAITKETNNAG